MSTNNSNEWVREGTPREDWDSDTDYGVEIDPSEWDDYSDEQAVHVETPVAARDYEPPVPAPEGAEAMPQDDGAPIPAPEGAEPQPELDDQDVPAAPEEVDGDLTDGQPENQPTAEDSPEGFDASDAAVAGTGAAAGAASVASFEPEGAEQIEQEYAVDEQQADEIAAADDYQSLEDESEYEQTEVRARPIIPAGFDSDASAVEQHSDAAADAQDEEADQGTVDGEPVVDHSADEPEQAPEDDPDATSQYQAFGRPEDEPQADDADAEHTETDGDHGSAGTAAAAGVGAAAAGAGMASLYRKDSDDTEAAEATQADPAVDQPTQFVATGSQDTQVIDQSRLADEEAAEQERQARLQQQRDARDARLGIVASGEEGGVRVVEKPVKRQADKFFGAFSLLVLRLITAAVIGALGYQALTDIDAATTFLESTVIPEPRLVAWILGFAMVSMAVLLVLGLGVRLVGFLLAAVAIASLATIRWGAFSVFQDGMEGFLGDRTLLTVGVGLVLMAFGAGRASIDGAIYSSRQKAKSARSE